jgi:hypothetical protein
MNGFMDRFDEQARQIGRQLRVYQESHIQAAMTTR